MLNCKRKRTCWCIISLLVIGLLDLYIVGYFQKIDNVTLINTKQIASSINSEANGILFISIVNHRENIIGENWILGMIAAGFKNNFRLITLDIMAYNRYSKFIQIHVQNSENKTPFNIHQYIIPMHNLMPNESTFASSKELEQNNQKIPYNFGAASFKLLVCLRPMVIRKVIEIIVSKTNHKNNHKNIWNYNGIFYIDVDTFMYKSYNKWKQTLLSDYTQYDLMAAQEKKSNNEICTCLLYFADIHNNNNKFDKLFNEWYDICMFKEHNRDDQTALSDIISIAKRKNRKNNSDINYGELPIEFFPNGRMFKNKVNCARYQKKYSCIFGLERHQNMTQKEIDNDTKHPFMIHANWFKYQEKIELLQQFYAWLIPQNETQKHIDIWLNNRKQIQKINVV
eukprot:440992_1